MAKLGLKPPCRTPGGDGPLLRVRAVADQFWVEARARGEIWAARLGGEAARLAFADILK